MAPSLPYGPIGASSVILCVDMQGLFAEPTEWSTPWMKRVLPLVVDLVAARPQQTVCTASSPPRGRGRGRARGDATTAAGPA